MKRFCIILVFFMSAIAAIIAGCGGDRPELFRAGVIAEDEFDPEVWGKIFPLQYESWLATGQMRPSGKSMYKKGWDDDKVVYDKLSEFPFLALLYNGWGFGVEYNEPRGHFFAIIDQLEIDPSRVKPGGVCLACKSPMHKTLTKQKGLAYLTANFTDAVNMIPEKLRKTGPACIDCHNSSDMTLRTNKLHIENGLKTIGKKNPTRQEMRLIVCGQCHNTYTVPRDANMKVAGDVQLPWSGSRWGAITIENIIKDLLKDSSRLEWKQNVTGFKMPFIRHPEFEMFTNGSIHFNAGLSCADCHMPYKRSGSYKISSHDLASPVKQDFTACAQCHTEGADWLRKQVFTTQERTISLLNRAGYANAVVAKLFEIANNHAAKGGSIDRGLYDRAKDYYMQAFLRLVFISAENSIGFHNSTEAGRVLGDSVAFANRAELLIRKALTDSGIRLPENVNLELNKYLTNRGKNKLNFRREQEFKDPYNNQRYFTTGESKGL